MIETYLRPTYQQFLVDPLAAKIKRTCSANTITLLACLTGLLILPALVTQHSYVAIILLLCSGYLDTLDGTLAREQGNSSDFGSMLDIVCDRFVEFVVILGLYAIDPVHRGGLCLLMLGSVLICVTTFLVVGIFANNTSEKGFHYSPGLMERTEAFAFFIAMIALPNHFQSLALCFSFLVFLTAAVRIFEFHS